jgi:hypothetical protein
MFHDRFEGSAIHRANRERLNFADAVMHLGPIKDEWSFIENETLRVNIASELQKVHFDVLLVNTYNVYYSPEAMIMKYAIIACASVAEAVLEVAVKMIQDDPNVLAIIQTRERVFDEMYTLQLKEFETPERSRVVTGVQREIVRNRLDRNTKMDLLIRAAQAGGIVDDEMAKKLQHLRRFRNRVHIKTVEELEYSSYTCGIANAMINILEEFRIVTKAWIEARQRSTIVEALVQRAAIASPTASWPGDSWLIPTTPPVSFAVGDFVEHATLGQGLVVAVEPGEVITVRFSSDNKVRRLMLPFAPMWKTGALAADDDISF